MGQVGFHRTVPLVLHGTGGIGTDEGWTSLVTGCRVSKYHVNRVNRVNYGTFPAKPSLAICSVDATETF